VVCLAASWDRWGVEGRGSRGNRQEGEVDSTEPGLEEAVGIELVEHKAAGIEPDLEEDNTDNLEEEDSILGVVVVEKIHPVVEEDKWGDVAPNAV